MRCPVCEHESTRVVDSRLSTDGATVRRRRECEANACEYRFSTSEEMEMLDISVVKRDGTRQSYHRQKMVDGLKRSLQKRSYTEEDFRKLVQGIERDIQKKRAGEITSEEIGEIVMRHLRRFDKVAYVRFASVYYSFEDLETFERELQKISKRRKAKKV